MAQGCASWSNYSQFRKAVGGNGKSLAPFGWVGGKSKLAPWLVELIPEHTQYVEVFGGALNLLWAKKPSKLETVNDIDGELVNLYRIIKQHPQSLSLRLGEMLYSRELFYMVKSGKISHSNNNKIERAALSYFIIAASFSAKRLHFGRNRLAQSGSHRRAHGSRLLRDFSVWSRRLKYVQIEHMEFEKLIADYDHQETFFYLDPPYYECEDYYVNHTFTRQSHEKLAELLKNTKGKWLLSYNDHPAIRGLYANFYIASTPEISYSLNGFCAPKKVREIIVANYEIV